MGDLIQQSKKCRNLLNKMINNTTFQSITNLRRIEETMKAMECELAEAIEANRLKDEELSISRDTINLVDDYFEYANESKKDRQKVHDILAVHMQLLMDMK